jgi:hypothetical protein
MAIGETIRGLLIAACAAMPIFLPVHWAIGSSTLDLDPARIGWSRLVFQASHGPTDARSEIRIAPISAVRLKNSLVAAADAPPIPGADTGAMLMTATVAMSSRLPFVADKTWKTEVWFLPENASALQRSRTKIGEEPDRKTFLYLADGVRRIRFEPEAANGGERQPEQWAAVRTTFFPYGPARDRCRNVSDPSVLFYAVSAAGMSAGDPPLDLCVFNKKTLYQAEIRPAGTERLRVNYTRRRGETGEPVETEIAVLKIVLSGRPAEPAERKPEPFEFFEMRGDIEISVDVASGLPVRVRGTVANIGEATFNLVEADLAR